MNNSVNYIFGIVFAVIYVVIGASQSVALNIWLPGENVYFIVGASFVIVTMLFLFLGFAFYKDSYSEILKSWKLTLLLNVTSSLNWIFYFLSVKYLVPSLAITLIQGVGPVFMSTYYIFTRMKISNVTKLCNVLILTTMLVICDHALDNFGNYSNFGKNDTYVGMILAFLCGLSITSSVILSKKLAARKIQAVPLLSVRFIFLILLCLFIIINESHPLVVTMRSLYVIAIISVVGVSLSIFVLQKGIEMTSSLAISTVLALAPFCVFIIEGFFLNKHGDDFSFSALTFIVLFSLLSLFYDARAQLKVRITQ